MALISRHCALRRPQAQIRNASVGSGWSVDQQDLFPGQPELPCNQQFLT